ncbi:MAG: contractile injection system tape measure protein [Methylobacter sp.]
MISKLLPLISEAESPEKLSHSVGRLIWDTSFDDQQSAYQLQEDLSHWSKTALNPILEQAFQEHCPPGKIWRINQLELDLGEIAFDELTTELPKRLRARLAEQLDRLLLDAERQTETPDQSVLKTGSPGNSQIVSQAHTLNDYVDFFLRTGTVPWWYTDNLDNAAILQRQLQNAPQQIVAIIRRTGQSETVRQRIVWQYQPAVLKKIVRVLEPHHHDYIVAFSDQLIGLQAKTQQPRSDRQQFERQSWLWILTHLLVDRGSLFNTVFFVESTLKRMAASYQLDYLTLLQQLTAAAQSVEYKSHATPQFIQALLAVQQKAFSQSAQVSVSDSQIDYWQRFTRRLHAESQPLAGNNEPDHLGELFILLADEDAAMMTALLKKEGREAKVRKQLLDQLSQDELSRVVSLLAPQDHLFIMAHAHQSSEVLSRHKTDDRLVWEVILAYLLKNSGSYFNRRQFVDATLQEMSRARGIDYLMLLDMLCATSMSYQRFELLAILSDLKLQHQSQPDKPQQIEAAYAQALAVYLANGQMPKVMGNNYLPAPEQLFSILLRRHPQRLASIITGVFNNAPANAAGDHIDISRPRKIRRLLDLIQSADFPLLLRTLDAQAAEFALGLIDQLNRWQRQKLLPSLNGFDLYYDLYGVVLDVLLGGLSSSFSVARFLSAFFAELAVNHGINRKALAAEILSIYSKSAITSKLPEQDKQALRQWLTDMEAGSDNTAGDAPDRHRPESALEQKISALLHYLRGDQAGLQQLGLQYDPATLSELLAVLLPGHADALLNRLQHQRDRNALIQALLKQAKLSPLRQWLDTLWPAANQPAAEFLSQWQSAVAQSGLWQSSSIVLQQKLHDIFWLSVMDLVLVKQGRIDLDDINSLLAEVIQLSSLQLHIGLEKLNEKASFDHAPLWQSAATRLADNVPETRPKEPFAAAMVDSLLGKHTDRNLGQAGETLPARTGELTFTQDAERRYLNHALLPEICRYLLVHGYAPIWLSPAEPLNLAQMIADLLHSRPQMLRRIIDSVRNQAAALFRLQQLIDYRDLLAAMVSTAPELKSLSGTLEHFYQGLLQLRFSAIDTAIPASLLWQQTLQAWLSGDWQSLSAQHIAAGICADLIRLYSISAAQVEAEFKRNEQHFPAASRLTLSANQLEAEAKKQQRLQARNLAQANRAAGGAQTSNQPAMATASTQSAKEQTRESTMPIHVKNAGLVLMQGFIGTYFRRLGLVQGNAFVSEQAQRHAVHHLQYLATGLAGAEEQHLVLNKLLCGLPPSSPIELSIELTPEDKQMGDSLIEAVIGHWKAIGSSSIEGFRGNWLVRNGLLSQSDDRWELLIEKRAYDLLLQRAPFSFHLVNFHWMAQPLYVTWPT